MKTVINDYSNTLTCGPFERSRLMRNNNIEIRLLGVKCEWITLKWLRQRSNGQFPWTLWWILGSNKSREFRDQYINYRMFKDHPFLWIYLSYLSYYLQTNARGLHLPRFKFCPVSWTPHCHLWFWLCLVNLAFYCLPEGPPTVLHLQSKGPYSAVLVDLNVISPYTHTRDRQTGPARCRLEVTAPPGHKLTVHLDHPKALPNRTSEKRHGVLPCFLKLVSICDAVLLLNVCLWRG